MKTKTNKLAVVTPEPEGFIVKSEVARRCHKTTQTFELLESVEVLAGHLIKRSKALRRESLEVHA